MAVTDSPKARLEYPTAKEEVKIDKMRVPLSSLQRIMFISPSSPQTNTGSGYELDHAAPILPR